MVAAPSTPMRRPHSPSTATLRSASPADSVLRRPRSPADRQASIWAALRARRAATHAAARADATKLRAARAGALDAARAAIAQRRQEELVERAEWEAAVRRERDVAEETARAERAETARAMLEAVERDEAASRAKLDTNAARARAKAAGRERRGADARVRAARRAEEERLRTQRIALDEALRNLRADSEATLRAQRAQAEDRIRARRAETDARHRAALRSLGTRFAERTIDEEHALEAADTAARIRVADETAAVLRARRVSLVQAGVAREAERDRPAKRVRTFELPIKPSFAARQVAYDAAWEQMRAAPAPDAPVKFASFGAFPWPVSFAPQESAQITLVEVADFFLRGVQDHDLCADIIKSAMRQWAADRFAVRCLPLVAPELQDDVRRGARIVVRSLKEISRMMGEEDERMSLVSLTP